MVLKKCFVLPSFPSFPPFPPSFLFFPALLPPFLPFFLSYRVWSSTIRCHLILGSKVLIRFRFAGYLLIKTNHRDTRPLIYKGWQREEPRRSTRFSLFCFCDTLLNNLIETRSPVLAHFNDPSYIMTHGVTYLVYLVL